MDDCPQLEPTATERKLIRAAACGEEAVIVAGVDDPSEFDWQPEHEIRADVIRALALGLRDDWTVDPRGLRLRGARVTGTLDLENGEVGCALELVGCSFAEAPNLQRAVTKVLRFTGSHLPGLSAYGLTVKGHLDLDSGFKCAGEARLLGATIGGDLDCDGGILTNSDGAALKADRIQVTGSVFLRDGFTATGELRLLGATIGGVLVCDGGTFTNRDGAALNADRVQVTGSAFLRGAFTGEVRLLGATIGSDLTCSGGTLTNPDGDALAAQGSRIDGHVFLRRSELRGRISLHSAHVGRDLQVFDAEFDGGLNLDHAVVGGTFAWLGVRGQGTIDVDLSHFAAGQLRDDPESWERVTALTLTGFRYDEISERSTLTPDQRLAWVAKPERFSPQPYEQLAKALRESGRPAQARKVAKAKEDALRTRGDLRPPLKAWNWFLGKTVGHGYELWRPLVAIAALLLVGTVILALPAARRAIVPVTRASSLPVATAEPGCVDAHPCYQPLVFTLDALVPIVDLGQDDAWRVNGDEGPMGTALLVGWWVYVIAGWTLTTAVFAGAGALLRRE